MEERIFSFIEETWLLGLEALLRKFSRGTEAAVRAGAGWRPAVVLTARGADVAVLLEAIPTVFGGTVAEG